MGARATVRCSHTYLSYPVAYAVFNPTSFGPTVGQLAASGFTFRAGSQSRLGERVASGLVSTFSSIHFVDDNAAYFAGFAFLEDGSIMRFGQHRVYVAITPEYRASIQPCADRLPEEMPGCEASIESCVYAEVMVSDVASTRQPQVPIDSVQAMLQGLTTPIDAGADPEQAAVLLEQARQRLLSSAHDVAATHLHVEAQVREYNYAHGFTPVVAEPNQRGNIRCNLTGEMAGEPATKAGLAAPASAPTTHRPVYSSPAKNMKAAWTVAAELPGLEGDELRAQQQRVQDLLDTADHQFCLNQAMSALNTPPPPPPPGVAPPGTTEHNRQASPPRDQHWQAAPQQHQLQAESLQ